MKIAYITTQFPAPSETFACNDVRMLKKLGVDISVFAQRPCHTNYRQMVEDRGIADIPIVSCSLRESLIGLFLGLTRPVLLFRLIHWLFACDSGKPKHLLKCLVLIPASFFIAHRLEQLRPDVVHLFWGHYPSLVGYLVRRVLPDAKLSMFLGAYDLEMELGISASLAKEAAFLFTHAKANLPQLSRMGIAADRVRVVYRGVDIDFLKARIPANHLKEPVRVLTAGRLISAKRTDRVLALMTQLPLSRLYVAGDGPELEDLKYLAELQGIKERTHFLGFLPQKDLFLEMAKSQFFIMLSDKEGERLPNVVKEAMFAGCVCIVSDTPGIEELIDNGKTGFIVSGSECNVIINIINGLGYSEICQIGQAARAFIYDEFDLRLSIQKYLNSWNLNV